MQKSKENTTNGSAHRITEQVGAEGAHSRADRASATSEASVPVKEGKMTITKMGKVIGDVALRLGAQSLGTKSVMSMLVSDSPEQLEELRGKLEAKIRSLSSFLLFFFGPPSQKSNTQTNKQTNIEYSLGEDGTVDFTKQPDARSGYSFV